MDFERLANRHKDAVYRQLLAYCGNPEDAEDSLIEALLQAYRASGKLLDSAAFRGWLASIGRRACLRMRRRDALAPLMSLDGFDIPSKVSLEEEVEMKETKDCIQRSLARLPELDLAVYRLREIEQLSAEEAAAELKLTVAAVKSRLHRARKMVRQALDEQFCFPV